MHQGTMELCMRQGSAYAPRNYGIVYAPTEFACAIDRCVRQWDAHALMILKLRVRRWDAHARRNCVCANGMRMCKWNCARVIACFEELLNCANVFAHLKLRASVCALEEL